LAEVKGWDGASRNLRVFPDLEALSRAAAALFAEQAESALAAHGRFSVALSGGSTPKRTYELLARTPHRDRVDWAKVHIFWGDERCVPPGDPRSNSRLAREALLERVPVPKAQVHPILCQTAPDRAARAYEDLLRRFFPTEDRTFDLIFLGLGEDGHTASLLPGDPVLAERQRWAAPVYDAGQELFRVTLTPVVINRAALVAFLVAGAGKAGVLREVLQGQGEPQRLPARLIRPEPGRLCWLADEAAAAGLPNGAASL
jgi:6-phosphogluconolactonase